VLFALGQAPPDLAVQGGDQFVDASDKGRSGAGQAHVKRPSVPLAPVPSHPARRLHVVDQAHHVVAVDPERVRQLLLGLASTAVEVAQDPESARGNTQRCQSLGEDLSRAGADLRHQEGQGLGVGRPLMLAHGDKYKHH